MLLYSFRLELIFLAKQDAMKWDRVRAIILPDLMDDP